MKVFISWSGSISFKVAKILKEWIPCIIQGIEPYFSSDDIDKGARWSTDIATELEEAAFGILCVTKENLKSQWLNFEAGALSKAIDKSKVCPFLFDLKPADLSGSPILQFQMTNIDRDDMLKLFQTMNKSLGANKLDDLVLEKVFTTFWPEIDKSLKSIEPINTEEVLESKKVSQEIMIEEMLGLLRSQQIMLRSPDKLIPREYFYDILQYEKDLSRTNVRKHIREIIPSDLIRDYSRSNRRIIEKQMLLKEGALPVDDLIDELQDYYKITRVIMKRLGLTPVGFVRIDPKE